MKAYILIKIRPGSGAEVIRNTKKLAGISEAHLTFGPYDAVAVVQVDSVARLSRIVHEEVHPIPGVLDTLTCLAADE